MRKISKLSLVAAVAVAGFSTANAQPLEQAIKDVEVSGSVVYRYNNYDNQVNGEKLGRTDTNNYKIGLNLASKVNDYVKFNSRFIVGNQNNGGFASLDSKKDTGADGQADVSLSNAYFGLTAIPNTVVNIGKQGLATPYTVATDINGNEQTGTGILALTTVGPVTGGLGWFNNTNLDKSTEINLGQELGVAKKTTNVTVRTTIPTTFNPKVDNVIVSTGTTKDTWNNILSSGEDMYVATLQGDLDFVKLEAWYAGLHNTFNTYTLAATGKLDLASDAKINLEARYVELNLDNEVQKDLGLDSDKNSMFRLSADGKFNIVNARLAYTQTGKKGGLTALDQDAKNASLGWNLTSNGVANADHYQAALGADILENLNFTMNYGNLKAKETNTNVLLGDIKAEEVYGQLTYKMSKNLNTYVRYGNYKEEINSTGEKTDDQNMGRIQVAYSF